MALGVRSRRVTGFVSFKVVFHFQLRRMRRGDFSGRYSAACPLLCLRGRWTTAPRSELEELYFEVLAEQEV